MKSFFILRFAIRNAETILEMVDWFFYIYTDFVGIFPFTRASFYTRIGAEIFLRININHSSAGRSGAWIITVALTISFSSLLITHPFHFGAYKFHGRKFVVLKFSTSSGYSKETISTKCLTAFLKLYKLFKFIFYPHYCNTVFFNFRFQLYYNSSITFFNKNGPATCVARPLLSNTISSSSPYPPPSLSAVSVSSLVLQLSSDWAGAWQVRILLVYLYLFSSKYCSSVRRSYCSWLLLPSLHCGDILRCP